MISQIEEINFPPYATLSNATVNLNCMDKDTITTTVKIDGSITPDFSYNWQIMFRGVKYIHPIRKPQAAKDNSSALSSIELTFYHWAQYEMSRYFFTEMTSTESGTAIADKYIASLSLNLGDFVDAFNKVLQYRFGDAIRMDLNPLFSYDLSPTVVTIEYTKVWDVLTNMYDLYAVRWEMVTDPLDTSKCIIRVGYDSAEIDHIFEYGFRGGLLKFEQQVQSSDIVNKLLGRGGEQNIPYRYFKDVDPDNESFAADPDWIPELANIYIPRLRDINFRKYIQGWKTNPLRDTLDGELEIEYYDSGRGETDWAYKRGHEDTKFDPVEYVKDDESIARYGEIEGGLSDNDDIYPTIQDIEVSPYGRIDETVSIEQIESDEVEKATTSSSIVTDIPSFTGSVELEEFDVWGRLEATSQTFDVRAGKTATLSWASSPKAYYSKYSVSFDKNTGKPIMNQTYVNVAEYNVFAEDVVVTVYDALTGKPYEGTGANIQGGEDGATFFLKVTANVKVENMEHNMSTPILFTLEINNIKLLEGNPSERNWGQSFDIWVKNIWDSERQDGESDLMFANRIWKPILGDRLGNEAKIVFSDGWLSINEDYEFTILGYAFDDSKTLYKFKDGFVSPDSSVASIHGEITDTYPSMWRLTLAKSDADLDSLGLYVPSTKRQGNPGDHFFFTGIGMPHQYVLWAEERLNEYKHDELDEVKDITPSKVVTLDKVRAHTMLGSETSKLIDSVKVGAVMRVADKRFIQGDYDELYIKSVTYTFSESDDTANLIPDLEIVLSEKLESTQSTVGNIQGEVSALQKQIGSLGNVEGVVRIIGDKLYLRKDGISDRSISPTEFSALVSSTGFRQGQIGGSGWGLYRDANGNTVFEADRMILRQSLDVATLVIHQTEWVGGAYVESAAGMECSEVLDLPDGYYCYFDQKQGTIKNLFKIDDVAMSRTYRADTTEFIFFKRKVIAVGENYIVLSKTISNGNGMPAKGDAIIQYGNYTDVNRQYVKVRDVIGGGYERFIENLNSVDTDGDEYYYAGKEIGSDGSLTSYRLFIGNKNADYLEWHENQLNIRGKLLIQGTSQTVEEYVQSQVEAEESARQGAINALQAQIDGVVESWSGNVVPTVGNYPASNWTTDIEKQKHIGDVYTDNTTGYAYRWYWNSAQDFGWTQISDTAAAAALNLAKQSVLDVDVLYQATTSQDDAPILPTSESLNGWQTDAPTWQSGYYIWTTTKSTYGDGTATYSDPVMISGKDGTDGRGIVSIIEEYYVSASPTALSGGSWSPEQPTWQAGSYIWTRSKITYDSGSPLTSYTNPICVTGNTGIAGTSVLAQYSSDATSWHSTYQDDDEWMRTSSDGGATWTSAIRIVGKDGNSYSPNMLLKSDVGINTSTYQIGQWEFDNMTATPGETYYLLVWGLEFGSDSIYIEPHTYNAATGLGNASRILPSDVVNGFAKKALVWPTTTAASSEEAVKGITLYNKPQQNGASVSLERIMLTTDPNANEWAKAASELNGQYTVWQWAIGTTSAVTGDWQDSPVTAQTGEYVWMRSGVVIPPATTPTSWSEAIRITGDAGQNGTSPTLIDLSDEISAVPCSADGTPSVALSGITTTISVYEGSTKVSDYALFKVDSGCTSVLSNGTLRLSALTSDTATVTITARKSGAATLTAVWRITKVKAGFNGSSYQPNALLGTSETISNNKYQIAKLAVDNGVLEDGEQYTLQVWGFSASSSGKNLKAFDGAGMIEQCSFAASDFDSEGYAYKTFAFSPRSGYDDSSKYLTLYNYPNDGGGSTMTIQKVMLTKGSDRPAWAPALSEMSGEPAVVYSIDVSASSVTKSFDGTLTPQTVTATKYKTTGSSAREQTSENTLQCIKQYGDGQTGSILSGIGGTVTVDDDVQALIFVLYKGDTTEILDRERVPVLSDASDMIVGGRNLATGTASTVALKSLTTHNYTGYDVYGLAAGMPIVVSFDIIMPNIRFLNDTSHVRINMPHSDRTILSGFTVSPVFTSDYNGHVTFKATVPEANIKKTDQFPVYIVTQNCEVDDAESGEPAVAISNFMVEYGNVETGWKPNPTDTDYLTNALRQSTTIDGGLIQTTVLQTGVTSGSVFTPYAGVNGIHDSSQNGGGIAFVAGGDFVDPTNPGSKTPATFGVRMDGTVWAANNTVRIGSQAIDIGDYVSIDSGGLRLKDGNSSPFMLTNATISNDDMQNISTISVANNSSVNATSVVNQDSGRLDGNLTPNPFYTKTYYTAENVRLDIGSIDVSYASYIKGPDSSYPGGYFLYNPTMTLKIETQSGTVITKMLNQINYSTPPTTSGWSNVPLHYQLESLSIDLPSTGGSVKLSLRTTPIRGESNMTNIVRSIGVNVPVIISGSIVPQMSQRTTMGMNGFSSIWGNSGMIMKQGLFVVIQGNQGLKLDGTGIYISQDAGQTWTSLADYISSVV